MIRTQNPHKIATIYKREGCQNSPNSQANQDWVGKVAKPLKEITLAHSKQERFEIETKTESSTRLRARLQVY